MVQDHFTNRQRHECLCRSTGIQLKGM